MRSQPAFQRLQTLFSSLATRLLGAVCAFTFLWLVARLTSVAEYGAFGLAVTISGMISYISNVGQRFVLLQRLPEHAKSGNSELASSDLSSATLIAGAGILGFCVIYLVFEVLVTSLSISTGTRNITIGVITLIFAQGWVEYISQALRADSRINMSIAIKEIIPRLICGLILLIICLNVSTIDALDVTLILAGCSLLCAMLGVDLLRRDIGFAKPRAEHLKVQFLAGLPLAGRLSVATIREFVDTVIVGFAAGSASVAVYFTIGRFASALGLPSSAFAYRYSVDIAQLIRQGKNKEARKLCLRFYGFATIISAPCGFVIWLFSPKLLHYFGLTMAGSEIVAISLILNGTIIASLSGIWEVIQIAGRSTRFDNYFSGIILTGIIVMIVASQLMGPSGVAVSYLSMNVTWLSLGVLELRRLTSDYPTVARTVYDNSGGSEHALPTLGEEG